MKNESRLLTLKELRKERKELKKILDHALKRSEIVNGARTEYVVIPEDIREAYFSLFSDSVEKKSIQHGRSFSGDSFLEGEKAIPFYGRDLRGVNFTLIYFPEEVRLEVSKYNFNGPNEEDAVKEIGLISTGKADQTLGFQTDLRVGENFSYHSGFSANHSISEVIDRIKNSSVIPHIQQDQLDELSRYKEIHKSKHDLETEVTE